MGELADGASVTVRGSSGSVYTLKNTGGVYSCTCPAWMHRSLAIERRTCRHLRRHRVRFGAYEVKTKSFADAAEAGAAAQARIADKLGRGFEEVS